MDESDKKKEAGPLGSCDPKSCGCSDRAGRNNFSRRDFLKIMGVSGAGAIFGGPLLPDSAEAQTGNFNYSLIPADKNLDPDWVAALYARGTPSLYSGSELSFIGMPVGGICCGQVYLGGDGRLWLWDIFNSSFADTAGNTSGPDYATPLVPTSPLLQGFALKIGSGTAAQYRRLDQTGFANISFQGQYPVGTVNYSDPGCPLQVTLEAFSPFIPLNDADSGIPAIVMEFTILNNGTDPVSVEVAGWQQNGVCLFTPDVLGNIRNHLTRNESLTRIVSSAESNPAYIGTVYEDFERPAYAPWVATGSAFGNGPANLATAPTNMGPLNVHGQYTVNTWITSGASNTPAGTLTSPVFTIQHDFINFLIGGGDYPNLECMNLLVNGAVVLSATGKNSNAMANQLWDVRAWKNQNAQLQIVDNYTGGWGQIAIDYIRFSDAINSGADIVYADFEASTYAALNPAWTSSGTAFGNGPVYVATAPSNMGPLNAHGKYTVNSYISSGNSNARVGTLTSSPFLISRNFITFLIGGGMFPGLECMNLLVNGVVVFSATGNNTNAMSQACWDVGSLIGQTGVLQIVDNYTGGWGQIGIDYIVFTNTPPGQWQDVSWAPDFGTMGLALLNPQNGDLAATAAPVNTLPDLFAALELNQSADVVQPVGSTLVGALGRLLTLAPGQQQTVTFVLPWHFPKTQYNNASINAEWYSIQEIGILQRFYATRFADAGAVADYVAANYATLGSNTRLWRDTWYNSTLPYWFLDRTFSSASTLATNTCHRFSNGRFWSWEGVFCCAGTCTHVWQYAQAVARLFPGIESDTRQRVDFGLAQQSTGQINYRAENIVAGNCVDGQAGCILRAYREHQMSADSTFLTANYPNIKKAMQWLMNTFDANGDGILEGSQWNTEDEAWQGKISWLSGLYVTACCACQQMALAMGDSAFATQLGAIAAGGANYINGSLFYNNEYFIQLPDSSGNNLGAGWGCHSEQVLGQSYAFQLGLGRVLDQTKTQAALQWLWTYNYAPDAGGFRLNSNNPVSGGRVYAMPGESGLVDSTFPDPSHPAPLGVPSGLAIYFNECWTGYEYQVAGHMIWEGMLEQGLAIARSVHDRYAPSKRNPYNEVECSSHYARAMASYGVFLATCGYEYNGPEGYLAFSPKMTPANFVAAFTAAEGWGTLTQQQTYTSQIQTVTVKLGQLKLNRFAFDVAAGAQTSNLAVTLNGASIPATMNVSGTRVSVTFASQQIVAVNQVLVVTIRSWVDTDGNGLPDTWEIANFGHIGVDPNADPDGDGMSNYAEYMAGTNPNDPASKFNVLSAVPATGGILITWASVPGKNYTILFANSLSSAWQTLQAHVAASSGASTSFLDTTATATGQRFYRCMVEAEN